MSWLLNKLRRKKIEVDPQPSKNVEIKKTKKQENEISSENQKQTPSPKDLQKNLRDFEEENLEIVKFTQVQTDGVNENGKGIASILATILAQTKFGTDLLCAGISLPSWLYEPMSVLQRQAEMLEYSHLLDRAAECKDPLDRMAFIAAFAVSGFSSTQRYHNDFNPLLGETFEFVDNEKGFHYISEQVSHHPPISATHAEKDKLWVFYQNSCPTTSFLGNSITVDTQGRTHVYFPQTKDHFFYTNPKSKLHNLLFGKLWLEHHGELNISNLKNGDTCKVNFKKCGLFGSGVDYFVEGYIQDSENNLCIQLSGRWDQYLEGTWLVETKISEKDKTKELWRIYDHNFINDKYHFSKFAASLVVMDDELRSLLPPTDSRLRIDKEQLVSGDPDNATKYKKVMEERQRQEKKKRESNEEEWVPTFFNKIPDEEGGFVWVYSGDYWEQREKKQKKLIEGEDIRDLLNGGNSKDTASDFRSYETDIE